jgi:hypothetical protein
VYFEMMYHASTSVSCCFQAQSVHTNNAWNPAQDPEQDINQNICTATGLQEDWNWRNEEGEKVEEDVRLCRSARSRLISGIARGEPPILTVEDGGGAILSDSDSFKVPRA